LAQHGSPSSPDGVPTDARRRCPAPESNDVTDIIPSNDCGDLADLEFGESSAVDRESQLIHAPELDDLHDTDDLTPRQLVVPSEFRPRAARSSNHAYRDSNTDVSDGAADTNVIDMAGRRGLHRKPEPIPVRGRLMIAAMAAGATAAAAHTAMNTSETTSADTVLAADPSAIGGGVVTGSLDGMQVVAVAPAAGSATHSEALAKGVAFAQERAEREARLQRPLFVMPTRGVFTSGFGYRWGVLHGGIDVANAIGTPILAASDGVVIDVGPTAGYGAWVKIRHFDGTVTLYGHVNTWLVSVGQRVFAGDQIATIGNRGNSTGPHLHFEVLLNGTDRVDPVGWLATRGISIGR
jgi:murein DD-endopeptidase MepM/ murein hydrolase activator NlpD